MLIDFKDENWEDQIKNEDTCVIQFSAAWCAPCQTLKPLMSTLSDKYKNKANFYYADIEDGALNLGSSMGVRGVPSTIIFKKGAEVDRLVGNPGEAKVKEFLDKSI
jgi:thioredoxin 1